MKWQRPSANRHWLRSLPARGARIEITKAARMIAAMKVAPRKGSAD